MEFQKEVLDYLDLIVTISRLLGYDVVGDYKDYQVDFHFFKDDDIPVGDIYYFKKYNDTSIQLRIIGFGIQERLLLNPTVEEALKKLEEFMNKL